MNSLTRYFVVMLLLAVSACGYHLRGYADLPFRSIYISNTNTQLGRDLKRSLQANGVRVVKSAEDADLSFEFLTDATEKRILSLGSSTGTSTGAVREFELFHRVSYRLRDRDSEKWSPSELLENRRDFSYSDSEVLAKAYEENMLYENMRADAVRQLMRKLSSYKPAVVTPAQ
jgi:LPS-assembly lipoprotein